MTAAAADDPDTPFRPPWLALGVLLAGLLATAALCAWSLRSNASEQRALFERRAESFVQALGNRVQSYIDTLPGLQTFGLRQQATTDAEFAQYVRAISLQTRFPGLALTFVAEWVPQAQREAYVARVRGDTSVEPAGHPGFDITPPGERPGYMVLRHTLPADPDGFGYDLYDPAQRYRAAVEDAIRSGHYVATGPLLLARDRLKTNRPDLTSIVVRGGIYDGGLVPATPQARLAAARGVVGVSFRSIDIVRSAMPPELLGAATLRIVDRQAQAQGAPSLVFDSAWLDPAAAPAADADRTLRLALDVANRQWDLSITPRQAGWQPDGTTWLLLALGAALSLSLAVMTHTLVRANRVAERRIQQGTAALQAEKDNLAKSEHRYRMLFTNSLDAVLRSRPDGSIVAANAAACTLFGHDEATLCRLGRSALVDGSDPRVAQLLAERQRSGSARGHMRMVKADGTVFEAEVASNSYAGDDGMTATSVIVRDVTASRRLAERQAMLSAILDSTPDFVASADAAGRNIYMNRAWRRLLARSDTDTLADLAIADCHPPWAAQRVLQQGLPAAARDGVWSGRSALLAADGREVVVLQVILAHHDADGLLSHYSTVAHDLTELERVQAERQALQAQLQESQKLEALGTLAGGVAHDFNNVLAAILGSVALARQDAAADAPVQASLQRIEQAASRARALVQQILTFSRRTAPARSVQPLQPAVHEALSLLQATLPATVRLQQQITPEPLPVLIDPAQVQQVVLNLCNNAWHALQERPGTIRVALSAVAWAEHDTRPAGLAAGRYALLQVSDDGIGMDEATRSRIFEPFFTTKPVGQGTGLGLSVVHGIVSGCGGAIAVHSAPGQGTRFDLHLPLAAAEAAAEPPPAAGDTLPDDARASGHVLVVDDDDVVALTLQLLLQRRGFTVTRVADGMQALALLQAPAPGIDIVVSDHNMPGMSGLELAQALHDGGIVLPLVITSGYVTEALQQRAAAAGVHTVLLKEYAAEQLPPLLVRLLQRA